MEPSEQKQQENDVAESVTPLPDSSTESVITLQESSEHSVFSNVPVHNTPVRNDELTPSVQNRQIPVFVLSDDEDDSVTFVSSQPLIPIIDITASPTIPRNSDRIQRHIQSSFVPDNVSSADNLFEIICNICLTTVKVPHSTFCGHIFCGNCIKNACEVSNKCPTCSQKLNLKQIHRIYL